MRPHVEAALEELFYAFTHAVHLILYALLYLLGCRLLFGRAAADFMEGDQLYLLKLIDTGGSVCFLEVCCCSFMPMG